jgi:signal transduction histidine kinase
MGFTSELGVMRKDLFETLASLRTRLHDDAEADKPLGRDFDEALSFIKSSITRMDGLIKAILKLTREGRRELRLETLDMTQLVRVTADGFGYQAHKAGASITIDPLPPCVADRLAIEQVFANLLENALKYLRDDAPGEIRVTGRVTPTEVAYEVRDNGRGINAEDLERVFEIFRRSGPQDRPGEGIGLTYVRTLVRRLGGSITVRSTLGQGSTFTVTLPCRAAMALLETTPWQAMWRS